MWLSTRLAHFLHLFATPADIFCVLVSELSFCFQLNINHKITHLKFEKCNFRLQPKQQALEQQMQMTVWRTIKVSCDFSNYNQHIHSSENSILVNNAHTNTIYFKHFFNDKFCLKQNNNLYIKIK